MKKKNPTTKKQPSPTVAETNADYTDCVTGECWDGPDDNQRTFVEPCDECTPCGIPSETSREGRLLYELAQGRLLTNELWHQISPSKADHDGRRVLSTLRNDYCIQLEWFYLGNTKARQHRIIPKCLPQIHEAIKHFWGRDLKEAAKRAKAAEKRAISTTNRKKGVRK